MVAVNTHKKHYKRNEKQAIARQDNIRLHADRGGSTSARRRIRIPHSFVGLA